MVSAREQAQWNRLADRMQGFHDYFLSEYDEIVKFSDGSFAKRMSLGSYLNMIKDFIQHLTMHHGIEEKYIFPVLAERMSAFAPNQTHKVAHQAIHTGLDHLERLVKKYENDPSSFNPEETQDCLNSFKEVLLRHLKEEVDELAAENMKKYWSLEEVNRLPM